MILLSRQERKTWEEPWLLLRTEKLLGKALQAAFRGRGEQMAGHLGLWQEESPGLWQRALI